jgi:hypothetical protein
MPTILQKDVAQCMGKSSTDSQNAEEHLWTIDRRSEGKSKVDKDYEATERHRSHANNSPQSSGFSLTAWTSSNKQTRQQSSGG